MDGSRNRDSLFDHRWDCVPNESRWLDHKAAWLAEGIELMQIRERDLSARQLADLTRKVLRLPNPHGTKILINDRADIAMACGAHGVHLRDGSVLPDVFARLSLQERFLVSVACHSVAEAEKTRERGLHHPRADFHSAIEE